MWEVLRRTKPFQYRKWCVVVPSVLPFGEKQGWLGTVVDGQAVWSLVQKGWKLSDFEVPPKAMLQRLVAAMVRELGASELLCSPPCNRNTPAPGVEAVQDENLGYGNKPS